ncbi:TetR/AcrR family transcriptional regulator [Streptococcus suis]|uniref:TetR/AcrR family transcriptional regulator n=1 Tax=Streptococcus suis TaxID=1307 RepID=UPI00209B5229|nr:TetR/AcrR family transcriptional regulator [Streptococcus suis]MCO8184566.1 TetR/AcrR family transcriptional regulator [Streptococcus suis]MCO8216132.1 TetR/AcrR family transcriptional regulator [Streptococcus suis]HEM3472982.1 TetR/AcrR family transcriptional regulator [Streptococcus suis]HEM3497111.1 TetR/AcrR family transcriptional regulator [Streptococcus suis]HEM3510223.1 TetR/AcrR family transcriptional regulator [Streptococcus suis]
MQNKTESEKCLMKEYYVENQLSQTLIQLLQEKDLHNLTVKEVCLKAQIGRASFYRYYSSLEDVLSQQSRRLMQEWGREFEANPQSTPGTVFQSLFQHFQEYKEFYSILYRYQLTQVIVDTIKEKIELTADLPNDVAYGKSFFAYAIFGWINEWISRGMPENPTQLNQLFQEQAGVILGTLQALYRQD